MRQPLLCTSCLLTPVPVPTTLQHPWRCPCHWRDRGTRARTISAHTQALCAWQTPASAERHNANATDSQGSETWVSQ